MQEARELDDVIEQFNSGFAAVCRAILCHCPQLLTILQNLDEQIEAKCARIDEICARAEDRNRARDVSDKNRARMTLVRDDVTKLVTLARVNAGKVRSSILW